MSQPSTNSFPPFLYGTAWKVDATERLTLLALQQGFRGIDTANQRKHYYEAGVGAAIRTALAQGLLTRDQLFLQTKFTHQGGQDHRLPYDPRAAIGTQVEQSFASSLEHLGVEFLDSYVLHGPSQRVGLGPADWSAWRAMEVIHGTGKVKHLGISNVSLEQLQLLVQQAKIPPRFVQNRCYASRQWDRSVREFCTANNLIYQGFSLLTANRVELAHPTVQRLAQKYQRTPSQIIFRFAVDIGMLPLTGTTSAEHMREDLAVQNFCLDPAELQVIENISAAGRSPTVRSRKPHANAWRLISRPPAQDQPAMPQDRRTQRDVHALTPEGMVLCNPRDKEAAHRAEMGDIATGEGEQVTCPKCQQLLREQRRSARQ